MGDQPDLTAYYRSQNHIELLCNYFSKNPQPHIISNESEFFSLYPNFDLDFFKKQHNFLGYRDIDVFNYYHVVGKYSKLITADTIKIVFYTPPIGEMLIGGVNAIYRMSKDINDLHIKNLKACIYAYDHTKPKNRFNNNYINPFEVDKKTIVVYPETITHNPLNAKHVIRWILLDLGNEMPKNHFRNWHKNDMVYFWEPQRTNPNAKQLTGVWVDELLTTYTPHSEDRKSSSCYMFHKYKHIEKIRSYTTLKHPDNALNLDKLSYHDILFQFARHRYFYSYDPNTFYNIIAPLCGCITILHPIPGISREEYFSSRIMRGYTPDSGFDAGIAYGYSDQEIKRASETLPLAKQQIIKMVDSYKITTENLVNDIYQYLVKGQKPTNTVDSIFYQQYALVNQ